MAYQKDKLLVSGNVGPRHVGGVGQRITRPKKGLFILLFPIAWMLQNPRPRIGSMNHLAHIAIEPPGEEVQMAFLASMIEGKGPNAAASSVGTNLISLYMARCASPQFDELWHLATEL